MPEAVECACFDMQRYVDVGWWAMNAGSIYRACADG
jgi:hypothetical protein